MAKKFLSVVYEKAKKSPHCGPVITAVRNFIYRHRWLSLPWKGLKSLKKDGIKVTYFRAKKALHTSSQMQKIKTAFYLSEYEQKKQERTIFPRDIKFSILVPVYNTPLEYLREMILSVQKQTYKNWELCLADGSDDTHSEVGDACHRFTEKDPRILYKKLEKNGGISENTNQCIAMSSGDYIGLFDHDDLLHPAALFEVMKAICEKDADFIYTDEATFNGTPDKIITAHFKPDYAPDTLRSNNYICHFTVFSRGLLKQTGGFRKECDGSQDHDLILRLTEKARHIVHIPKLLYFWRASQNSTSLDISSKPYVAEAGRRAVHDSMLRCGLSGTVESSKVHPTVYRIKYELSGRPLISIIIPNKDHCEDLRRCVTSIIEKSTYPNYEIIIVDNGSTERDVQNYYEELSKKYLNIKILHWDAPFNYPAINNYAVKFAAGAFLLFLNNDTEVISPGWIEEMLMYAQRDDVGAVGAKLYFPDNTIQHAGVIIGLGGIAGHAHRKLPRESTGYIFRLCIAQDLSAVTAACLLIGKDKFNKVNGFDEKFAVDFNDVDFCLRLRSLGLLNIFTPYAELYHYESKTRSIPDTPEKQELNRKEIKLFKNRWGKLLKDGDPYYNPNLTLDLTKQPFSPNSDVAAASDNKQIHQKKTVYDRLRDFVYAHRYSLLLLKGIKSLRSNGIRITLRKAKAVLCPQRVHTVFYLDAKERKQQENTVFPEKIKFSLLVPVYNTPLSYLREMIHSVLNQTYKDWELCLADGSDADHEYIGVECRKYAKKDHRIVYKKLEKNEGITGNTNQCIAFATGDFFCLLDHDDLLHPAALYEEAKIICKTNADFIYSDEATFANTPENVISIHFKPDFAIDNLRASNYINHFTVFSRQLQEKVGAFRKEYNGAQDFDLVLRLTEQANKIAHISKPLYFWRFHTNSYSQDDSSKQKVIEAGRRAVEASMHRLGIDCSVAGLKAMPWVYRVKYKIIGQPLVSIIIPSKNHYSDLKRCVTSILEKSSYPNYEIIIVDNSSTETAALEYERELAEHADIKILHWDKKFNFSAINNFAVHSASGQYVLFLNNDTGIITPGWIEELLMYAQRNDVGAVGTKLIFADGTLQHGGIILGIGPEKTAGLAFYKFPKDHPGYAGRLLYSQDLSAVSAACMMVRKETFLKAGGFDEQLSLVCNDVDFCLKLRKLNLLNVFTPYAELYHYEAQTLSTIDSPEEKTRCKSETELFRKRWSAEIERGDPYYNPNLTQDKLDFSFKQNS